MIKTVKKDNFFYKLLKDFFSYGAVGAISKFIGFFTIPVYARFLSPVDFGALEILSLLIALLSILSTLQLENSFLRLFFEKKELYARKELFSSAFYIIILNSILVTIILLILRLPLSKFLLGSDDYSNLLVISLLQIPFNNVFGFASIIYRVEFKRKQYSILQLIFIFSNVSIGIYFVAVLKFGLMGLLASRTIIVFIFSLLTLFIIIRKYLIKNFSFPILKEMLIFSVPLIPGSLTYWIQRQFSRIYIFAAFSLYQLGIYAVASKLAIPIMLIISSLKMAWTPYSFEQYEEKDSKRNFNNFLNLFSFLCFILVISLTIFSKEIITIFATNKFLEGYILVGWILLMNMFEGQINLISVLLGIKKKSKEWSTITIIGMASSFLAMYLFSKVFGIVGIVIGGLVGEMIQFFIMAKIVSAHSNNFFNYKTTILFQIISILFVCCFYIFAISEFDPYIRIILSTLVFSFVSFVAFKNLLFAYFKNLRFLHYPLIL